MKEYGQGAENFIYESEPRKTRVNDFATIKMINKKTFPVQCALLNKQQVFEIKRKKSLG